MKNEIFFSAVVLSFLFLCSGANALKIDIDISEKMEGNISSLYYNESSNLVNFIVEFYNIGSIGYNAAVRMDIFNENYTFTAWSEEKTLFPGIKKTYDIYWFSETSGNFTGRIRIYYGNEILEKYIKIRLNNSVQTEDGYEIKNFDVRDNFVRFNIMPKERKNFTIIPYKYPSSWIFEQSKVQDRENAVIKYKPSPWYPTDVKIAFVSDDMKYFTIKNFRLEKKPTPEFINFIIDLSDLFGIGYVF